MVHGLERVASLAEKLGKQAVDSAADVVNRGHCQLAFTAGEVVIEAALGRAGNVQKLIQTNAMQPLALQGVGHGVNELVAG